MIMEKIKDYKCELTIEQRQHLINLTKSMSTLLTEDEFYKIIKIYDDAIIRCVNNQLQEEEKLFL